jgi:hypothetical protein
MISPQLENISRLIRRIADSINSKELMTNQIDKKKFRYILDIIKTKNNTEQ